jgi:hypothetical protein
VWSLDEWCFDFYVVGRWLITERSMDQLLWSEAIPWAESQGLGIGGGFRPASARSPDAARCWHFRLGLCAQRPGLRIPESQVSELWDLLRRRCGALGYSITGGFHEFGEAESAAG